VSDPIRTIIESVTAERIVGVVRALVILVAGLALARLTAMGVARSLSRRLPPQERLLLRRVVFYTFAGLIVATSMHQLGFKLGVLLGAAGVLTVALGFASQTSASNLISGLFLIFERPFIIGDVIEVDGQAGEVLSIDLLSVKLRTFDNQLVRVPNESIIKSRVYNKTHFPIRRVDVQLSVAYKEDLRRVRQILLDVADRNPLCLSEPNPLFLFLRYGDSGLEIQFSVWSARQTYVETMTSVKIEIKEALDAAGIEIPFPHRTLYVGAETAPFPVRVVEGDGRGETD